VTYILIPGADGRSWYWNRVEPLLREGGHEVVTVDLPVTDPVAGLEEYAGAVMAAIGDRRTHLVLLARDVLTIVIGALALRAWKRAAKEPLVLVDVD